MFVYMVHIYTKGKTNLLRVSVGMNDIKRERGCLNPVEQASVYVVHCIPPIFGKTVKVQQRGASQRLVICDMKIFAFGKLWIQRHTLQLTYMWGRSGLCFCAFVPLCLWSGSEETNQLLGALFRKLKYSWPVSLWIWVLPNNRQSSNLIGPIARINIASSSIDLITKCDVSTEK